MSYFNLQPLSKYAIFLLQKQYSVIMSNRERGTVPDEVSEHPDISSYSLVLAFSLKNRAIKSPAFFPDKTLFTGNFSLSPFSSIKLPIFKPFRTAGLVGFPPGSKVP